MITELYKKLKRTYVGSILDDIFSKKRPINDDSDEEEEDIQVLTEPPFKKSRFSNENLRLNIGHTDKTRSNRPLDGNTYFLQSRLSSFPHYSGMSNFNDDIEYLGSPGKMAKSPSPKPKNLSSLEDKRYQSPALSLFKFSPSLTSTVNRSNSKESSSLSKSKITTLAISKSTIQKKKDISRFCKKSNIMAFINPTGRRKMLTPRESFRIEDKERYRQLIQQYTSSNVTQRDFMKRPFLGSSAICKFNETDVASRTGAIIKTHLDPISTTKSRLQLESGEVCPMLSLTWPHPFTFSSSLSLCSLTKKTLSSKVPVIDLETYEPSNKEIVIEDDDDIFITKEITKPKALKNSLEDKLQQSSFYGDDWLKDIQQYYKDKNSERDADVELIYETKRQCEQSRVACEKMLLDKVAKRISQLDIKFPTRVTEVTDEEEDVLPELSPEVEDLINRALKGGPGGQVLADKFNIQITRRDLHTLSGLNWLNDEVINFYMNLLMERGQNDNYIKVYAFNTFFYSKLVKTGYSSVKRWTKKVDIFSHDLLLIPVHLGMHWCLATIDFRSKSIRYYDSMLGDNHKCLAELKKYLTSEHVDKKKCTYDKNSLSTENVKDIPQQMNGSDCGMFACKFAEYLSRDAAISFSQEHMPYFRRRMVYEIIMRRLM